MKSVTSVGLAAFLCAMLTSGARAQNAAPPRAATQKAKPLNVWAPSDRKVVMYTKDAPPATPKLEDLPLKESVSQYGITWTFEKPARVGQFVTGDFYVVGPVTVKAIDPKPLHGEEIPAGELDGNSIIEGRNVDRRRPVGERVRNGFMLNPPAAMKVSYDDGVRNWFDPSLIQRLPVALKAGDSLVSTISMPKGLALSAQLLRDKHERGVDDSSPIRTAAVLTCVEKPLPPDAFRPGFTDRTARIYLSRDLKRDSLPKAAAKAFPDVGLWLRFTERPWIGTCFFGFADPAENMPAYGLEYGRIVGLHALLCCTDLPPEKKETILVNLVQIGIDLAVMIRAGHPGFAGFGGHGSGRKLPIVFAGLLLGDEELAHVNKSFPKVQFGEDEQTAYGDCWTGAKVVFAGHRAIDQVTGIARPNTGPYEHKQPKDWTRGDKTSEGYRRCCTSVGWVAQALAMKLMHAEKNWNHDAFFDYCDRWMHEDETEALKTLRKDAGIAPADWAHEGQVWEPLVNEMWAKYRPTLDGPTDGWKKQHDDSYLKSAMEKAKVKPAP